MISSWKFQYEIRQFQMTLTNDVLQRNAGCYHVTHPWPLNISRCQKGKFLPAVQNIMHNLQVNGSYAIKNGGSDSLQYVKHKTITQTIRVFSIIFDVLMQNLDKKQKFFQQHGMDIALSCWCSDLV